MTELILLLVVAGSYLAAHVAFDWIARRFRIVSGVEYLLLGMLLGPLASGLLSREVLRDLSPLVTLGLGWTGARLGSQFILSELIRIRGVVYRVAFVESLITLSLVSTITLFVLSWTLGFHARDSVIAAVALGAMATVSGQAGVAVASRGREAGDPLVGQLRTSAAVNAFVAVATFGLLTAAAHPEPLGLGRPPTITEWAVINLAVGGLGGGLFHLFLGEERHPDRLFIALVGAIVLVSGAAAYLRLSPILAALMFGATVANTSRRRREIAALLARVERPLYFVLLILAGAWWAPSPRPWVLTVALFLLVRTLAKVGGARLVARANGRLDRLGANWGRGLLGQGGLALVIGLSYLQFDDFPVPTIVFTAVVISLLLTDLLSARFAHAVFQPESPSQVPLDSAPEAVTPPAFSPEDGR